MNALRRRRRRPRVHFTSLLATMTFSVGLAASAPAAPPPTFFDHVQHSWAVGTVTFSDQKEFRDGRLLVSIGQIVDLVHAKRGKPRGVMFTYELEEGESAPYDYQKPIFVVIELLPKNKYWRENLPPTSRHTAPSGSRYIFSGEDLEPASELAKAWAATLSLKGPDRWRAQHAVLASALLSDVDVLREDAVRHLSRQLPLTREIDDDSVSKIGVFILGDSPAQERERVIRAAGRAGVQPLAGPLEKIAAREDALSRSALDALNAIGKPRTPEQLKKLSDSKNADVRAFAVEQVAAGSAGDDAARKAAVAVLLGDDVEIVRTGAAIGLGRAASPAAIEPLGRALARSDGASRAAGSALAAIGGPEAVAALKASANEGGTAARVAAVLALGEIGDSCADCTAFLQQVRSSNSDPVARDIAGVVLESGAAAGN